MDQRQALDSAVKLLLEKAQNVLEKAQNESDLASAVEAVSGALKLPADLEKSRTELNKLELEKAKLKHEIRYARKRGLTECIQGWVSSLAPIVAIVSLVATLAYQAWQFRKTEKDQRDAAEDARWADTVKAISQNSGLSPSAVALNPFLKSERYGRQALDAAVQLLSNTSDTVLFADLFGAAFVPVSCGNLAQVLALDRALRERVYPLLNETFDPESGTNDWSKLTPEEKKTVSYTAEATREICSQLASVLSAQGPRRTIPDLSDTRFVGCDWSGVDLSGANIERMMLAHVDLEGANLGEVTRFEGASFTDVAWWNAKTIDPKLLEYLEGSRMNMYEERWKYGTRLQTITRAEYSAALRRLHHAAP
jgi:hypothetical protein